MLVFPFFTYADKPEIKNEFLLQKQKAGSLKIWNRLGSSFGDVRKVNTVNRIEWGERGFFARANDQRMTFILDTVAPPEWYKERNPDLMPDDAIISTIYLD